MAFLSEKITSESDIAYFHSFGFTNILDKPAKAYWWAIDREREIFLFPRGGGSFEIPLGYGLCIDGELVEIEAKQTTEGSRNTEDLRVHWNINAIKIPGKLMQQGQTADSIEKIVEEAFLGLGTTGMPRESILETTVEITAKPMVTIIG